MANWTGKRGVGDIRHDRIQTIRGLIEKGWKMPRLRAYCTERLGVSATTAKSYIDEAAEPYRKIYRAKKGGEKK